ncbi:ATP-binding protein [Kutzneria sp. CA-103260]|uniref:ATP-binding protein n=1 Tax=Kutzneria sp. CA-103260 TaxID=2802641 RepID=UPI001BAC8AB4|nr:biotin carboxylase N-terminal domain-containing protein [Kutzneria sp. CA-103260]QUQ66852.1 acetyl/propionyl-CoA carboxylase, biotin carboxylase subunit fused with biotin carboxyl carrier subunit [Kutzneria sp. CA-103260]
MITRLLVANRGEIARRVFRSCRLAGISPVAVFSDPDADAPFVAEADHAVRLPGAAPSETYLRIDALIAAARATGADAVHPGYGFLSENAGFARAVLAAGLTWVGPSPESIEAMGSKVAAKKRVAADGVPVLAELDPETVTEDDLPVLIKASAGGGGRGMRIVRELSTLREEVAAARREAESAFGDGTVFCEPLLEGARHVEVQILADSHGTVWALGERECSIQRRHQKIVEETPSPAVTPEIRTKLFDAAVAAARSISYVGAGTVEFLLSARGTIHFLEVNTRLQVEHPVTECVYGIDLVRWQLAIAEGAQLPADHPTPNGHAIEVRLYAEDPSLDWRPQSGVLHRFALSDVDGEFTVPREYGLRLDSGVEDGSVVGVHYDPMLAKVIAWGPDRAAAARRLSAALASAKIHGVLTNRDLLVNVLRSKEFLAGDTDTGFLDRVGLDQLAKPLVSDVDRGALVAAIALAQGRQSRFPLGWRNIPSQPQKTVFEQAEVTYRFDRDGKLVEPAGIELVRATEHEVVLDVDGVRQRYEVARYGDTVYVGPLALTLVPRFPDPTDKIAEGATVAPMPGTVVRVSVQAGETVAAGAELLVLEAMKMEHRVVAAAGGTVAEVLVQAGQQVEAGAVLAVVEGE